jgi:hypothetical protein
MSIQNAFPILLLTLPDSYHLMSSYRHCADILARKLTLYWLFVENCSQFYISLSLVSCYKNLFLFIFALLSTPNIVSSRAFMSIKT